MPALEEAVSELGGVVVSAVLVLLSAAEAVIDASLWLRDVSLSSPLSSLSEAHAQQIRINDSRQQIKEVIRANFFHIVFSLI